MRRFTSRLGWCATGVFLGVLAGCGHAPVKATQDLTGGAGAGGSAQALDMEPLTLEVRRTAGQDAGFAIDALDAPSLFADGGQAIDEDRFADAARSYDRLVTLFPTSAYVPPALLNAALSYEGLGRYADAIARYRRLLDEHGETKERRAALIGVAACYAETNRWPASIEVLEQALQRTDLSLNERVEAMARRALALFEIGDVKTAEAGFRQTVAYHQANQEQERLESRYFLGLSRFYIGHIAHRRFREAPLRTTQLKQDLEAKAQAFVATQALYVDSIKVQNAAWATASGYHIGSLYREMYDAVLSAPLPPELGQPPLATEKRLAYIGLVKDEMRVLLEKAKSILEDNVVMAERVGVRNGWVDRSGEQLAQIERMLAELGGGDKGDGQPKPPSPSPSLPGKAPGLPPRSDAGSRAVL